MTSNLEKLKSCKTKKELSVLLSSPLRQITWLVNVSPENSRYNEFCISKKNGNTRTITAPQDSLKQIQKN